MIDLYTKTVLTVIAAALVGIVAQQAIPGATAQPASTCGQEANPCAVFMMTRVERSGSAAMISRLGSPASPSKAFPENGGLTQASTYLH